jgi:hypothetical protein
MASLVILIVSGTKQQLMTAIATFGEVIMFYTTPGSKVTIAYVKKNSRTKKAH